MPHDLPPYTTVYGYFQKWQCKGLWQRIQDQIRGQLRNQLGRDKQSTVARRYADPASRIADSQSIKTTEKRDLSTVLTAAKRLKGVSDISS